MHHPTDRIAHTTAFVTPVVEHLLERKIAQWVHPMKDRSDDPSHHERTLLPRSYIPLPVVGQESSEITPKSIYELILLFKSENANKVAQKQRKSCSTVDDKHKLFQLGLEYATCTWDTASCLSACGGVLSGTLCV